MELWLIAALLFLSVPQTAQPVDSVRERLANVGFFAFGGVGYAGTISSGEKDFKIILSRTSAMADFEKLYSEGNLQAKCYALVGIHKLNPARSKELMRPMRGSREMVATMEGCILSKEAMGEIIKEIESGRYVR